MVMAVSSEVAARSRRMGQSPNGETRWYTDFIGEKAQKVEDRPESNLVEMGANQTVMPHFHQVNQFQIMTNGSGSLGRGGLSLVALHYTDHNTAYGPIKSGPYGLCLFTIRAQCDPSATYLHQPGYREALKPSKQRYILSEDIQLSVPAVMQNRVDTVLEDLLDPATDSSDGLAAHMLRMGAGARFTGPDPRATGGQYYMVLNGTMEYGGARYPAWSMLFSGRTEEALEVAAGAAGVEALLLHFPRPGT